MNLGDWPVPQSDRNLQPMGNTAAALGNDVSTLPPNSHRLQLQWNWYLCLLDSRCMVLGAYRFCCKPVVA